MHLMWMLEYTVQRRSRGRELIFFIAKQWSKKINLHLSWRWQRWSLRQEMHDRFPDVSIVAPLTQSSFINNQSLLYIYCAILCGCICVYMRLCVCVSVSPKCKHSSEASLSSIAQLRFIRSVALKSNFCQPSCCSSVALPLPTSSLRVHR